MTGFPDSVEGFVEDAYTPIAWKGGAGNEGPSQYTAGDRPPPEVEKANCQTRGGFSQTARARPVQDNAAESGQFCCDVLAAGCLARVRILPRATFNRCGIDPGP